ncbi:phage tail protein [Christiangramia sp.]|uniref:phage tail protein n=1 Tax=Christiangramia sp. TaxID=1931228 RepID=UPI00260C1F44|nr:phage tail protein [Christiangramia sp.]
MIIYRYINEVKTQIHDIDVDEQTELRQKISGEDLILSRFTLPEKIDIQIGDFVEFKDSIYTILDEPSVKKSQAFYAYNLQFKSDQYILKNVTLINPDTEETEFYLFGDPIDMVSLVISNMNRVYSNGNYYADYVEQLPGKNLSFTNTNCLAALQQIAQEFECEFQVKGKKITFRKKLGNPTGLTFKYHKELREIERVTVQNPQLVTVLYPYGSDRNITHDYGYKRLRIPKLERNKDKFGTIERTVTFEDIYPRLDGNVSAVQDELTFRDTGIDFDIRQQLIGGIKAKVIFNTGDLAGREFEIERYDHDNKQIRLLRFTDDADLTLPNNILKPRVGDEYVLINIDMPQSYVDEAEAELLERATEHLNRNSLPNVVYKVKPHYPALRKAQTHLNLGDIISIEDQDFELDFDTRIIALTQKINKPFEYSIEISDQVTISYITRVLNDARELRNNIYLNERYWQEQFNRVFNNVQGFSAPLYVNRGLFNPANYYYNNQNRRDYVYRLEGAEGEERKVWYFYIGEDHQRAEWIQANWQLIGDQFEILATETLLASNANIGNWLIQNGMIVSQSIYASDDETEIEPTVQLNGREGYIKFVTPRLVWDRYLGTTYVKQTMIIDGRTGEFSVEAQGVKSVFSMDGLFIETKTGHQIETPDGVLGFSGVVSKVEKEQRYRHGIHIPYAVTGRPTFLAAVVGVAENTYGGADRGGAAPTYGGAFWGLKSAGRYVGVKRINDGGTYNLHIYDEVLSCYNSPQLKIQLPEPENTPEGRILKVKRLYGKVAVHGKLYAENQREVENIEKGDLWTFINDGKYWLINYQGRTD